ncbi:hypothetical protein ACF1GT_18325 [Streptomyces sp. NPDC014636]|uniref:hypothetical protein n=1 Tax=Streptomyces sp. NPDC014636 TaxID=3364876 RepID=UPI00370341AA
MQDVLAELAELHDRVDWGAVITLMSEHEYRVAYSSTMALEVPVVVTEGQEAAAASVAVEPAGLHSWAQSTADEVGGLPFSLYVMHRVLVGDTLLGKPLMEVFCRLAKHKEEIAHTDAAMYFLRLVAVQAQGYAMLGKARQALGLPADQDVLFRSRIQVQSDSFARTLDSLYGVNIWNVSTLGDSLTSPTTLMETTKETKPARFLLVGNNREVLTRVVVGDGVEKPLSWHVGRPIVGSDAVEAVEVRETFFDGNAYRLMDLLTKHYEGMGGSYTARMQPFAFIFEDPYVLVGLHFSTVDGTLQCEPLVAAYDRETGTTSWNGTDGDLWKVTDEPDDRPGRLPLWLGDSNSLAPYTFYKGVHDAPPTTVRGVRFHSESVHSGKRVHFAVLDGSWGQQTNLPYPPPTPRQHLVPFQP